MKFNPNIVNTRLSQTSIKQLKDLKDFPEFVANNCNILTNKLEFNNSLIRVIFKESFNLFSLNNGSGLNNNKQWRKHRTWQTALYDIWEQIQKDSNIP
jgi:hypothetical protein